MSNNKLSRRTFIRNSSLAAAAGTVAAIGAASTAHEAGQKGRRCNEGPDRGQRQADTPHSNHSVPAKDAAWQAADAPPCPPPRSRVTPRLA